LYIITSRATHTEEWPVSGFILGKQGKKKANSHTISLIVPNHQIKTTESHRT